MYALNIQLTTDILFIYFLKFSLEMCGICGAGETTALSVNPSPQVFVKKSISLLLNLGSLSTAGKLILELNTVHLYRSCTTDGSDDTE